MTWGQLKEQAERVGVTDDAEIVLVDCADDRWGVATAELNGEEFQLVEGDEIEEEE